MLDLGGNALESSANELNLQSSNQHPVPEALLESSYGAHCDTQKYLENGSVQEQADRPTRSSHRHSEFLESGISLVVRDGGIFRFQLEDPILECFLALEASVSLFSGGKLRFWRASNSKIEEEAVRLVKTPKCRVVRKGTVVSTLTVVHLWFPEEPSSFPPPDLVPLLGAHSWKWLVVATVFSIFESLAHPSRNLGLSSKV
ncbi:hypothetical protein MUK42_08085 [Musa troglodytarum]|uniref:Uncharacterized protein n=1 Tax=Musa troglodytarum TaxID=320322 RepID=A0A9E7FL61_9LILI|nr:hypothetical protein MUK42_08085 [Musa troglodytarum]